MHMVYWSTTITLLSYQMGVMRGFGSGYRIGAECIFVIIYLGKHFETSFHRLVHRQYFA